jgi:hypothetical protein
MGQNAELSPFWIYFCYPLVITIRMAHIFFALFRHYITTGTIPFHDTLSQTIFYILQDFSSWIYYIIGYISLYLVRHTTSLLKPLITFVTPFWIDFDHGPTRQALRASTHCHSKIILCFDHRLLILSEYCTYPWWTPFFSSPAKWFASIFRTLDSNEFHLQQPSKWIMHWAMLWPPDGPILRIFILIFLILTHFFLFLNGLVTIMHLCIKNLGTSLPATTKTLYDIFIAFFSKLHLRGSSLSLHSLDYTLNLTVLSTLALSVEDADETTASISWDSDSIAAVLDNSANTHIWTRLDDFVPGSLHYFDDNDDVGVITIGDDTSRPVGIGTVPVSIVDNSGNPQQIILEKALFFPASPVNIISVTHLAKQFNDKSGTWIQTRWRSSTFTWNHGSHTIDFDHPSCNLPVINVNLGFSEYDKFASMCDAACDTSKPSALTTCRTYLPTDRYSDICFTADDIQSGQCDPRYRFTPKETLERIFSVGDKLRLCHNGINQVVEVLEVELNEEHMVPYFKVLLNDGHSIQVTKESLRPLDDDDIALLPITQTQVEEHINRLDPDSLEALLNPPANSDMLREFMAWHNRSGHLPFSDMFKLCKHGYFPRRFLELQKQKLICPSCTFGKCRRRPWRTRGQPGQLRSPTETKPGDRTSIDHVISAQPGLVPRMDGRHTRDRINSGCVFFDHISGHSYTHLQTSVDNDQTIAAKRGYEQLADSHGVKVKAFHADNGIFAEKAFRDEVSSNNQTITYCAVGAHHQNGIVERHIQSLTHGARTNLLHAQRRWPEAIGSILWPFAWKDFERRWNSFHLDEDGLSPLNKFSGVHVRADLRDFHPFGCPVFVLDSGLQSVGASIPKWDPRARAGIYLGHSPCHAGSVALVLNPKTLRVSPQFHVVFDDEFATVPFMRNGEVPPNWSDLVRHSATLATDEDFDLATTWANNFIDGKATAINEEDESVASNILLNHSEVQEVTAGTSVSEEANSAANTSSEEATSLDATTSSEEAPMVSTASRAASEDQVTNQLHFPTLPDLNDLTCRRSSRTRRLTSKAKDSNNSTVRRIFSLFVACTTIFGAIEATPADTDYSSMSLLNKVALHTQRVNTHFDGTINKLHHAVLMADGGDNDTYHLKDMLKQEDKSEFISAMVKEVQDHESRNHWTVLPRSAMPIGTKSILSIWSFKRKRSPDGRVLKHKARLCAHGGMQTWGVNYWETYAPVVNWLSVRTLMALSIIHDLETRSIDFVLAFPQADLDTDVYMELPFGFDFDGRRHFILKLNKNLYGLKNASLNFFNFLKDGLEARGYEKQSASDSCVFLGKNSIVLVYVDDCIIVQKKGATCADDLIKELQEGPEKFSFTDDGDLEKYLGVDVKRHKDGRIELTQRHLIQRTLDILKIDENVHSRPTPAIKPLLFKDIQGLIRKHDWNYRQIIGMLTYLQGTSRPDISMAVHQAARFCIDPKLSHERAIYRIGKYLEGTKDKGIIFKPDATKGLECFVDADFAGGWNKADANTADAVMSRTGYVIMYAGCPITWCSKLQTEIALSTTEAEYIALSQSLREVIPVIDLMKEINEIFPINIPTPEIHCKVWEDNNGALALANGQKFSPRTKHIAIKYHHFRSHIKNGTISVHPIDTKEQTADIFTKPLDQSLFIHLRRKLSGW